MDLGCGFGWHCIYAVDQGAASVIGIDISENMLKEARRKTTHSNVTYICSPIEDYEYPESAFDIVISSLALHYMPSFDDICSSVSKSLIIDGEFVFSVEHPIFTSQGKQDWVYDETGIPLHWPVDNYFIEGKRNALFLGENVIKYHKTITTYIDALLRYGFSITGLFEPKPEPKIIERIPMMKDELRRPMMLIVSAKKV